MTAPEQGDVSRHDVEAMLEVRKELGPSYDAALVDSFADRIERAVAQRVDSRLRRGIAAVNAAHASSVNGPRRGPSSHKELS